MSTPITGVRYWFDPDVGANGALVAPGRPSIEINVPIGYDWNDTTNVPWAYTSETAWTNRIPGGSQVVPLSRVSADFWTNLNDTINTTTGRVIIDLRNATKAPETFHLKSFRLIGSSGDPVYSFGFWFPDLAGFIGHGPDKTKIQMDANSMTTAQLDKMKTLTKASFGAMSMALCRIDGVASPIFLGGVCFQAADQNLLAAVADPAGIFVPRPAPHNGVALYQGATAVISHCLFRAAGHAWYAQPPFECTNLGSQYETVDVYNSEFDGRRAPEIDPARPRRCNAIMPNNATRHTMTDCYIHHTNLSRYAANDQNRETFGQYTLRRVKADFMSEQNNTDPAFNSGLPLGGGSPITPFGFESSAATITFENCIIHQRIGYTSGGQKPAHIQLTTVGSRNPQGGRLTVTNVQHYNEGYPDIDEFFVMRVGNTTFWKNDGYATTMNIAPAGVRLTAYVYTGTWPPSKSALAAIGIHPETHYLVALA